MFISNLFKTNVKNSNIRETESEHKCCGHSEEPNQKKKCCGKCKQKHNSSEDKTLKNIPDIKNYDNIYNYLKKLNNYLNIMFKEGQ